jgi:hypothetical protein
LESINDISRTEIGENAKTPAAGDSGALKSFLFGIRSKETEKRYIAQLGYFFDFLKIHGATLADRASTWLNLHGSADPKWAYDCLIDYITFQKERVTNGEITGGTVGNYYGVVKSFYQSHDIELNWKKIEKGLPEAGAVANDRAPTLEEIRKICEYPDRRIKVLVYVMVSSGIRIGAWEHMRLKHITPVYSPQNPKVVVAAKLSVYEGRAKPYVCFATPEAYQAVQEYMDFRTMHGETITPESWVLRDKFETTADGNHNQPGTKTGLVTNPKKLQTSGIKKVFIRAMRSQGIRNQPLQEGERRYEFKLAHGYRKYFKTNAERVMRPINVEILMDHKTGISDSYYRPTQDDLLEDYLRAVDYLTVNRDQKVATQLQKQVAALTEKSEQENYVIQGKLAEKERETENQKKELEELKTRQSLVEQMLKKMLVFEWDANIDVKHPEKIEHESLEQILQRLNISTRRLAE